MVNISEIIILFVINSFVLSPILNKKQIHYAYEPFNNL